MTVGVADLLSSHFTSASAVTVAFFWVKEPNAPRDAVREVPSGVTPFFHFIWRSISLVWPFCSV